MPESILIHKPPEAALQLMLLFHGVGSSPQIMVPIGRRLAAEFPRAAI